MYRQLYLVMTTNRKQQVKQAAAKLCTAIFGTSHFVFDSLAELSLEAEKSTVNKLTGKSKQEIGLNRILVTSQRQSNIIDQYDRVCRKVAETKQAASFKQQEMFDRIYGSKGNNLNNNPETI